MDGTWQKVLDGREMTQAFGQAMGNFVTSKEKAYMNATTEYGTNRTSTHTVSATVDFSMGKGYAMLQVRGITIQHNSYHCLLIAFKSAYVSFCYEN